MKKKKVYQVYFQMFGVVEVEASDEIDAGDIVVNTSCRRLLDDVIDVKISKVKEVVLNEDE